MGQSGRARGAMHSDRPHGRGGGLAHGAAGVVTRWGPPPGPRGEGDRPSRDPMHTRGSAYLGFGIYARQADGRARLEKVLNQLVRSDVHGQIHATDEARGVTLAESP